MSYAVYTEVLFGSLTNGIYTLQKDIAEDIEVLVGVCLNPGT